MAFLLLLRPTIRRHQSARQLVLSLETIRLRSSSSDEEETKESEAEANLDPKDYRSWVEDALKGVKADVREAKLPASRGAEEHTARQPSLSSVSDGKALQFSGGYNAQAEPSFSAEGTVGQISEDEEDLRQQGLEELGPSQIEEGTAESLDQDTISSYRRLTVKEDEDLLQGIPEARTGYREIASRGYRAKNPDDLQISGGRRFRPGDVYDAEDLVSRTRSWEEKSWVKAFRQTQKATDPTALRETDFRNVSFLHKFTSEAGNIPARKVTRLQKKVHTHVMRNIKTARTMGLMPRLGKIAELMPPFRSQK